MRNSFKDLEIKKRIVWELMFEKNMTKEAAAKEAQVSLSTIGKWIKKYKWKAHLEFSIKNLPITNHSNIKLSDVELKKLEARNLLLLKGFIQRDVAKIVGVSEKTITNWVKKYNWNDFKSKELQEAGGLDHLMRGFFYHIILHHPEIHDTVKSRWFEYLKNYEKQ